MDSSGQVNSGQMGPRSLPRDTLQAGFAQPWCLFALGRAFPSVARQPRCQDVTLSPARLLRHTPGQVPASGVLWWHGAGAPNVTDPEPHLPQPHLPQPRTSSSTQGSSSTAKRASGAQQCWAGGSTLPGSLCRGEGSLLTPWCWQRMPWHRCWSTSHPALLCSATGMLPAPVARSCLGSSSLPGSPFCCHTQQPSPLPGGN